MLSALTLRPYQVDAAAAVTASFESGSRSTLVVMATGLGKTVLFAHIAEGFVARGLRVLVLAHRSELLQQAQRKLRDAGVWAELEQARYQAGSAPVVVASVQTLRGKRLERFAPDAFDLIVVDEAHHAAASGYRTILDYFASALVLGVTATPDRMDGQGMGQVFQAVAYRYELREAIADGWLAPIRAMRIALEDVDLSEIKTRAGDLAQDKLAEVMGAEQALHQVAVPLLRESSGRRTMLFAVDVAHARALAEVLNRYQPGCARALDGSADEVVRRVTLEEYERGDFRIMVNVALFTEGFDDPRVACIGLARPTKSRGLLTQIIGRGTRLADGKADCLVLDFCGNVGRHRLVGPADVLAGRDLEDDELRAVEGALDAEQLPLEEVLEHAEAEAARSRAEAKVTAVARYVAEEVDPFLGAMPTAEPGVDAEWAAQPMTERQHATLVHLGHTKLPEEMTRGEASRLLDAHAQRREGGLATYKMVKRLVQQGYENAPTMTFGEASAALARCRANGWRPSFFRRRTNAA